MSERHWCDECMVRIAEDGDLCKLCRRTFLLWLDQQLLTLDVDDTDQMT